MQNTKESCHNTSRTEVKTTTLAPQQHLHIFDGIYLLLLPVLLGFCLLGFFMVLVVLECSSSRTGCISIFSFDVICMYPIRNSCNSRSSRSISQKIGCRYTSYIFFLCYILGCWQILLLMFFF